MQPILLIIRKKFRVPTKHQRYYMFRSDWMKMGRIEYEQSKGMFKNITGRGLFETDAQFAFWLYKMYGEGIYGVNAWRKGREGFWGFFKVHCTAEGFKRLPQTKTKEELDYQKDKQELGALQQQYKHADDPQERETLQEDIDFQADLVSVGSQTFKEKKQHGPYPYLKSTHPVYSFHAYESYGITHTNQDEPLNEAI